MDLPLRPFINHPLIRWRFQTAICVVQSAAAVGGGKASLCLHDQRALRPVNDASQNSQIIPFPGGLGKIYHCTAAQMIVNDFDIIADVPAHGADGFFSYDMNIDFKR